MRVHDATSNLGRWTVVYDGECSFCRNWARRMSSVVDADRFEFVSRQTEGITERFPALREGDFNSGIRVIAPDSTVRVGADGIYEVMRRSRAGKYVAWLYKVPGIHRLANKGYAWVAAHRHALGGRCRECESQEVP